VAKGLEQMLSQVPPVSQQDKEKTKGCTFKSSSIKSPALENRPGQTSKNLIHKDHMPSIGPELLPFCR
jgi:hypothetical protein